MSLRKLPLRSAVPSSPMRFTEAGGVNIVDQDLLGAGWRLGLAGGDGFLFSSRRDLGRHDLAATGVIRDHPSNNAGGPHPWLEGSTRAAPFRVVTAKLVPAKTSSTTC